MTSPSSPATSLGSMSRTHRPLERSAAKVASLLEAAEDDLLAHMAFPAEHWSKLCSTNPLERLNREIGRRSDVVGIYPNDAALIRLAGALLLEQNDEWLVGRRYLSVESLSRLYETLGPEPQERRVVPVQTTRKEIALASP
jgi:putative transposase